MNLRKGLLGQALTALAIGLPLACGGTKPPATSLLIHDTTGAAYLYICDGGHCAIQPTASSPTVTCVGADGGTTTGMSYSWGRFFFIDAFGVGSLERLVACTASEACPTAPDGTAYACTHGLCQKPGSQNDPITAWEAIDLCQANDPWPSDCGTALLNDPAYGVAANKVFAACPAAAAGLAPPDAGSIQIGFPSVNATCPVPASCLQP